MSSSSHFRFVAVVLLSASCLPSVTVAAAPDHGFATVPSDASFCFATLRAREQIDAMLSSNAYRAVRDLPAVERAIKAFEEERSVPASPLSLVFGVLERPENQRAVELVEDLLSHDTFVYGEPSCTKLAGLLRKLQEANQASGVLRMLDAPNGFGGLPGGGIDFDALELDADEEDEDDGAALDHTEGRTVVTPARFRAVTAEDVAVGDLASAEEIGRRLLIDVLVDDVDSIVVPDIVWGFRTTKPKLAKEQIARLDELVRLAAAVAPGADVQGGRRRVGSHEFLTIRLPAASVPWEDLDLGQYGVDAAKADALVDRLRSLELVVAIGLVDDRVVLSLGGSLDHLEKLVKTSTKDGLASIPAFRPLEKKSPKRLTGVSYVSEPLARAATAGVGYLRRLAEMSGTLASIVGKPAAEADIRRLLEKVADDSEKRLPEPGAYLGFSWIGNEGYEGEVWDWTRNLPLDGSKPLGLFEHAGGAPLGAVVLRAKNDPAQFDEIVSWIDGLRSLVSKHLLDDADRDELGPFVERYGPLATKLAEAVRTKLLPSLADGQIAFVLDAKSRVERLHEELPAGGEPLPLVEPAIVLGVSSPASFQDGINDLFAIADEFVEKLRESEPGLVPDGYRIPEPEKTKIDSGTIWSFALPNSGLDPQIRPSIALGRDAAVFTLVPKQAARLLAETKLETASQLADFGAPASVAAALDCAGLLDAIEPWVVYGIRYAAALRRDGSEVDPSIKLDGDAEDEQARDVISQAKVVFNSLKCLRAAAATMTVEGDAHVTRWRNVIRDTKNDRAQR